MSRFVKAAKGAYYGAKTSLRDDQTRAQAPQQNQQKQQHQRHGSYQLPPPFPTPPPVDPYNASPSATATTAATPSTGYFAAGPSSYGTTVDQYGNRPVPPTPDSLTGSAVPPTPGSDTVPPPLYPSTSPVSPTATTDRGFQGSSPYSHQAASSSPYGHQAAGPSPYGHQTAGASPYGNSPVDPYAAGSSTSGPRVAAKPEYLGQIVQSLPGSAPAQAVLLLEDVSTLIYRNSDRKLTAVTAGLVDYFKQVLHSSSSGPILIGALRCLLDLAYGSDQQLVDDKLYAADIATSTFNLIHHSNPEVAYLAVIATGICKTEKFPLTQTKSLLEGIKRFLGNLTRDIASNGSNIKHPICAPAVSMIALYIIHDESNIKELVQMRLLQNIISNLGYGDIEMDECVLITCALFARDETLTVPIIRNSGIAQQIGPHLNTLADQRPHALEQFCESFVCVDNFMAVPLMKAGFLSRVKRAVEGPLDAPDIINHMTMLTTMAMGENSIKHEILMALQLDRIFACFEYERIRDHALVLIYYLSQGDFHQKQAVFSSGATQRIVDNLKRHGFQTHNLSARALLALSNADNNQRASVIDAVLPFYLQYLGLYSPTNSQEGHIAFYGFLVLSRLRANRDYLMHRNIIYEVAQVLTRSGVNFRYPCFAVVIAAAQGQFFSRDDPSLMTPDRETECEKFITGDVAKWREYAVRMKPLVFSNNDVDVIFALCSFLRMCWGNDIGGYVVWWMQIEGINEQIDVLVNHRNPSLRVFAEHAQNWVEQNGLRTIGKLPLADQQEALAQIARKQQQEETAMIQQQMAQQQAEINKIMAQYQGQMNFNSQQQIQQIQAQFQAAQQQQLHQHSTAHKFSHFLGDGLKDQIQQQIQGQFMPQQPQVDYSQLLGAAGGGGGGLGLDPGTTTDVVSQLFNFGIGGLFG